MQDNPVLQGMGGNPTHHVNHCVRDSVLIGFLLLHMKLSVMPC